MQKIYLFLICLLGINDIKSSEKFFNLAPNFYVLWKEVQKSYRHIINSRDANFYVLWTEMQRNYGCIINSIDASTFDMQYCHPQWASCRSPLQQFLLGSPQKNFINFNLPGLCWTNGGNFQHISELEQIYLQHCISDKTQVLINKASDSTLANLPFDCKEFYCSPTSLRHLFYIGRVLEGSKSLNIKTVVEVGSGYGNLVRLFKQILPETTFIMFDLPEMLALQWLYLKLTLPQVPIFFHTTVPEHFEEGAIHLLPSFWAQIINIKANIFLSTFALTESTEFFQKEIIKKNFFDADVCYLAGQIQGWSGVYVDHKILHEAVRKQYSFVTCSPIANSTLKQKSFEMMAIQH